MYGETTTKNKIFAFTPEVGADEYGFYCPAGNIIPDCKANLTANIRTASLLLPYARVTAMDDKILVSQTGFLHYNIKRLGIPDGATFTVSITALDSWLTVPATPKTYTGLTLLQDMADSFSYSLSSATPTGQQVGFVLKTNNGLYDTYDTVRFFYGKKYHITTASTSTLSDWFYSDWSVCTSDFHSAPSSLKSSPTCGNYADGDDAFIALNTAVDLRYSSEAWLRFFGKWGIESKYDYASVQASVEGTGFWQTLCGEHTHGGTTSQLYNEPIYDAQQPDWVMERMSLNDYLGQKILLKFELISDAANNYEGFQVDDIEVRSVQDTVAAVAGTNAATPALHTYPNPANNSVTISLSGISFSQPLQGVLYDCLGRETLRFVMDKTSVALDVKSLPAGVYSLKVSGENTTIPVHRILVSR